MLFAVEGGGFFSSSASGYSKGLTLLLLGQKNEDKPMRVAPWNQYQLVDCEPDPDPIQLASTKNRLARGCASFVCFGRASPGPDTPSPLKVGPAQQQDLLPGSAVSEKSDDRTDGDTDYITNERKESLKSSLKKPSNNKSASVEHSNDSVRLGKEGSDILDHTQRRKVQWTDACGSELAEIKEFEPSEVDLSDDEFENGTERSCSCAIM